MYNIFLRPEKAMMETWWKLVFNQHFLFSENLYNVVLPVHTHATFHSHICSFTCKITYIFFARHVYLFSIYASNFWNYTWVYLYTMLMSVKCQSDSDSPTSSFIYNIYIYIYNIYIYIITYVFPIWQTHLLFFLFIMITFKIALPCVPTNMFIFL